MAFDPNIGSMNERLNAARGEIEAIITKAYPRAQFSPLWLDDPEGVHLRVVVPVDDAEEVFNLAADRLLHFQIEEGLPLYLVPLRPVGQVLKQLEDTASPLLPPQANP
jgi:hypothetical protein